MAWRKNMLIGKVNTEKKAAIRKGNKAQKKLLKEIPSCLNNLDASKKRTAEDQKNQKEKLERMAGQFNLYLCYVHHMDITPTDGNGAPTWIKKTHTVAQREESKDKVKYGKKNLIILD
jgi:hypothetical protein